MEEDVEADVIRWHQVFEIVPLCESELVRKILYSIYIISHTTNPCHDILWNSVNRQLLSRPEHKSLAFVVILEALAPSWAIRQLRNYTQSQFRHLSGGIEYYVLFRLMPVLDVQVEEEAPIDAGCDEFVLFLQKVHILNESYFQRQLSDQNQVLVEYVDFEVRRYDKVHLFSANTISQLQIRLRIRT